MIARAACFRLAILAFLVTSGAWAAAPLKLASIFSDHMVLQQGAPAPVWGTAPAGSQVKVEFAGQTKEATADAAGKWRVTLDPLKAGGGPLELKVAAGSDSIQLQDVLAGEVWLASGQSNMEWPVRLADNAEYEAQTAFWSDLRVVDVPNRTADQPQESFESPGWKVCSPETAPHFSAVGYYFARHLHQQRNVPVGIIQCEWGGTPMEAWTSREAMASVTKFADDEAQAKSLLGKTNPNGQPMMNPANVPTALFNGMVAPIIPFAIRGVIWYQGESNAGRHAEYAELSKLMIADWRKRWDAGDFPFLLVQLAGWEPGGDAWPLLREAQLQSARETPKVGMAVAIDVGDRHDIHPRNKQDVGRRLALAARAIAYGEPIEYSGPVYREMETQDGRLRLAFDHTRGGLNVHGDELTGFEIAGADGKFVPARAEIDGADHVILSADGVAEPRSARYDWAAFPDGNLFNGAGLPAVPFRSSP